MVEYEGGSIVGQYVAEKRIKELEAENAKLREALKQVRDVIVGFECRTVGYDWGDHREDIDELISDVLNMEEFSKVMIEDV